MQSENVCSSKMELFVTIIKNSRCQNLHKELHLRCYSGLRSRRLGRLIINISFMRHVVTIRSGRSNSYEGGSSSGWFLQGKYFFWRQPSIVPVGITRRGNHLEAPNNWFVACCIHDKCRYIAR